MQIILLLLLTLCVSTLSKIVPCEISLKPQKIRRRERPLLCNYGSEPLIGVIGNQIYKLQYSYMDVMEFDCCYQPIDLIDNNVHLKSGCIKFNKSIALISEYAKISCSYNGSVIYEDYVWKNYLHDETKLKLTQYKAMNVIVLILSNMTRNEFIQLMPKTKAYLEYLQTYDFYYFQAHGNDTKQNLEEHLINTKTPIWDFYQKNNFKTAYAQDCFSYENLLSEKLLEDGLPFNYHWQSLYGYLEEYSGYNTKCKNPCSYCLGSHKTYEALLDYANKIIKVNRIHPLFGLFYINVLKYYNYPMKDFDKRFELFFISLYKQLLEDTVLIFMSDINVQKFKQDETSNKTNNANALPFLFISLPLSFKQRHPKSHENFLKNSQKMVTYADIFRTLRELSEYQKISKAWVPRASRNDGYTLFNDIPDTRTCSESNIQEDICVCKSQPSQSFFDYIKSFFNGEKSEDMIKFVFE